MQAFVYVDASKDEERELSFEDLHRRALGLGLTLREHIRPGDRVLLLLGPGLDYVTALFGCFQADAVGVAAPPPQPHRLDQTVARLLRIAEDAGVSAVLITEDLMDAARSVVPKGHTLRDIPWFATDAVTPSADREPAPRSGRSDLAVLQYTSGSTADPRGVRLTNDNLLTNSDFIARAFGHSSGDCGFNWIPPFHDMGLIGGILQSVHGGGTSVLASPLAIIKRPIRWLEGVSRYGAATSGGPNFSYDLCVERVAPEECEGLDLSCWRVAFNGAEPIRAETIRAFGEKFADFGFRPSAFLPCYGLAEATLMVTAPDLGEPPTIERFDSEALIDHRVRPGDAEEDPLLVGCGKPDSGHRLEIVDPETHSVMPPDAIGEIWVSGPSVADGYWNLPEESAESFGATLADDPQGACFLRTGDLGMVSGGELFVVGRTKELIIVNGRNHHPHDVEQLAEAAEPILRPHASAAFQFERTDGQPQVGLVAESDSRDEEDLAEAIARVRRVVGQQLEIPLSLVAICGKASVPKTTSGKIQRRLCRSLFFAGELEAVAEWRSSTLDAAVEAV